MKIDHANQLTINEGLTLMAQHSVAYPTHGINCACKDSILRAVRAELDASLTADIWQNNLLYLTKIVAY